MSPSNAPGVSEAPVTDERAADDALALSIFEIHQALGFDAPPKGKIDIQAMIDKIRALQQPASTDWEKIAAEIHSDYLGTIRTIQDLKAQLDKQPAPIPGCYIDSQNGVTLCKPGQEKGERLYKESKQPAPQAPNVPKFDTTTCLVCGGKHGGLGCPDMRVTASRGEGAQPSVGAGVASEMDAVAIEYAHSLALNLECIIADDYSGKWYTPALEVVGKYRSAMAAIHEKESPTYMDEPFMPKDQPDWIRNATPPAPTAGEKHD